MRAANVFQRRVVSFRALDFWVWHLNGYFFPLGGGFEKEKKLRNKGTDEETFLHLEENQMKSQEPKMLDESVKGKKFRGKWMVGFPWDLVLIGCKNPLKRLSSSSWNWKKHFYSSVKFHVCTMELFSNLLLSLSFRKISSCIRDPLSVEILTGTSRPPSPLLRTPIE